MTRSGSTASSTAFSASNDDQDEEDDDDDDENPSGTYDLPLLPPPTTDSTLSMGLTTDWHSFAPSTVQTDPAEVAVAVFPINYAFPAVVSDQHPPLQHQHQQQHVVIDPSARGHAPVGAQNRVEERMTRSEGKMAVGGGGGGAGGWYGLDAVASVAAAMEDDNDDHDKTPGTMMQVSSPA
jgi:hypothetical protein